MFTVFVLEFTCVFKWYVSVFIAQKALRVGWFPGSVVLVIAMTWAFLRRCDFLANASTSQGISEKGYDSRADFKLHSTLDSPGDLAIFYWLHWRNPWQFDLANVFKSEYSIEWMRWISQTMNGEDVLYIQMPYLVNDASCSESHQTPSTQVIFDFCLFIFPTKADMGPWSMTSQLASKH